MQRRCAIFIASEGESLEETAHCLLQLLYPDAVKSVSYLKSSHDEGCFHDIDLFNPSELFFLGHSAPGSYAGYSAEGFVAEFDRQFLKRYLKENKTYVYHIYLLGCDMGLIDNNKNKSVAQKIANAFYKSGYKNMYIHCIAKPECSIGDELSLEIISEVNNNGLAAQAEMLMRTAYGKPPIQAGYIHAYLKSKDAILKFIDSAHPRTELNKPQNIFMPNENNKQRKLRIEKELAGNLIREYAEAIAMINNRREYLLAKARQSKDIKGMLKNSPNKLKARALKLVINTLRAADETSWQVLLDDSIRYLTNHLIYGPLFAKDDSNSLRLLVELSKQNYIKVNQIIEEQKIKIKAMQTNDKNTLKLSESLLSQIQHASAMLGMERVVIRNNCFSIFRQSQLAIKREKMVKLEELLKPELSLEEANLIASHAMQNLHIIAGRQSRTLKLLEEVINEAKANGLYS